ncbi:hypothetical protein [Paenibacillus sp. FSL H3-0469]|uniref:RCC1 domain-containing protein n=1 Tax=Paenibacillus sp. FSL H3-0469 TaxID=2954506 RepID=UPI003100CCB0
MGKLIKYLMCIIILYPLINAYGVGVNADVYADSNNSIGILSTSMYPDSNIVKFGEEIYINYSFNDYAHPILMRIYKNDELLPETISRSSSWGGKISYKPKDEGKYRFVITPTDASSYTNECTVTVYKDRIIFLHGTMGSELFIGENKIWMPNNSPGALVDISKLQMNSSGESVLDVKAGHSLDEYYSNIISFLSDKGYKVVDAAYDWRMSSSKNAVNLKQIIEKERALYPYSNYYIIAHSMGGLVATEFIRQGNGHLIKKMITLATPFLGTPQAAYMFETGNITGDSTKDWYIHNSIKDIEKNIPSLYELLPSKKYFDFQNNGYLQLKLLEDPNHKRAQVVRQYNYDETNKFFKNNLAWSNNKLYDQAINFHSDLNLLNTLQQVDSYYFVGDQKKTLGKITYRVYSQYNPYIIFDDVSNIQGDNTVPVSSATIGRKLAKERTYFVKSSHLGIVKNNDVQQQILNILNGKPNDLVGNIRRDTIETDTLKLKAECPVELHVYDSSGNHTGPISPNEFDSNIPDGNYYTDGETKIALVNAKEDYSVRIKGTGYGELTFSLIWADSKDLENKTLRFDNIAVTPTSIFKADVNQSGQVVLQIDQNGDGNFEGSINPSVDLDLGGTQDETIPTLASHVTGVKGVNDWYGKNVHYNLTGEDSESGVYKYFYDLNDSEYKEYTEPVALPNTGIYNFKSYVRDKNRNDSEVLTETVKVDTTNPTVPVMTVDPTTWTNKFVTITLDGGTDADSGFQKYQYKINSNGEWKDYTAPFVIDSEGLYNVYARSVDNVFNLSAEVTGVAKVDKTNPPKPTMTVVPSKWTNQLVTITLSGGADTDKGFPNSGFQKYQYKIDSGEWKDYTTPIVIDSEGLYKVTARSVDIASNLSGEVSGEAKIDRTNPPKPTMTVEPLKWTNKYVTVTLTGGTDTDKGFPNSGFQKYQYKIDGSEWKDYIQPIIVSEAGLYNVYARSIDNVGLISDEVSGQAKVDKTNPSMPTDFKTLLRNYDQITISWSPSIDNIGVTGYDLYQDSVYKGTIVGTEYTFTNLEIDTKFQFKIVARDEAGNSSNAGIYYDKTPLSLISAGMAHGLYIKPDGSVWTWGRNTYGELGDGTTTYKTTATQVYGIDNVISVAAGDHHSLALKSDGSVWAWGNNDSGQLGTGSYISSVLPVKVVGLNNVISIASNKYTSYALQSDGSVWSWGSNLEGQLGVGYGVNVTPTLPSRVLNLNGVIALSAKSETALALKSDGTVWGWGYNNQFQLGGNYTDSVYGARKIVGLSGITQIAAGRECNLALKNDGTAWKWGRLVYGLNVDMTPVYVSDGVKTIGAGIETVIIVKTDGTIQVIGSNSDGENGNGDTGYLGSAPVKNLTNAKSITGGLGFVMASKTDGSVWTWGRNGQGQLGDGTLTARFEPVQLLESAPPQVSLISPHGSQISPEKVNSTRPSILWDQKDAALTVFTAYQVQVLSVTGEIVADSGVIEQAVTAPDAEWTINKDLPADEALQVRVKVKDERVWSNWSEAGWLEYSSAHMSGKRLSLSNHGMYVKADGSVWTWGGNWKGQMGDGTLTDKTTAVQVPGLINVIAVSAGDLHSMALKSDGSVWAWGNNWSGQLGTGDWRSTTTPVQVSELNDVIDIAANNANSYALKQDGTVWAWGYGNGIGNGTTASEKIPVQVQGLNGVRSLSAIDGFVLALKSNGTVWGWGENKHYRLRGGGTETVGRPRQITGIGTNITEISAGNETNYALTEDGLGWRWGGVRFNSSGLSEEDPPVHLNFSSGEITSFGSGVDTKIVSFTSGQVQVYGSNEYGQYGRGTAGGWTTAGPVNNLTDAVVVAGGNRFMAAAKADGSVWTWGYNDYGQLGDGTVTARYEPVQLLENAPPQVSLISPNGDEASPVTMTITHPSILWTQKDADLTVFTAYQVQLMNAVGEIIIDSGVLEKSATSAEGQWIVNPELPSNEILQVRVRVKDEAVWSEWSSPGWIKTMATTPTPTAVPTPSATATPTAAPTPSATATPTAAPTPSATATPTAAPTPSATATPTAAPTPSTTSSPTATPTPSATDAPIGTIESVVTDNSIQYILASNHAVFKVAEGKATRILEGVKSLESFDNYGRIIIAVKQSGDVYGIAANNGGLIGLTDSSAVTEFTKLPIENVNKVFLDGNNVFYLKNDKTLWASGFEMSYKMGVGNNPAMGLIAPVLNPNGVGALQNVLEAWILPANSYIQTTNALYSVGTNYRNYLGNNTLTANQSTNTPIAVMGIPNLSGKVATMSGLQNGKLHYNLSGSPFTLVFQVGADYYYWGKDPYVDKRATYQATAKKATQPIAGLTAQSINLYKPNVSDLTNLVRAQDHYSSLQNGTLYTFGVPIIYFLSPTALPGYSPYIVTPASRISGVKKYYPVGQYNVVLKDDNTAWFIYDNFGIGKIEGPSGELKNVKDIIATYHDGMFYQNLYTNGMSGAYYIWEGNTIQKPVWFLKENGDVWVTSGSFNSSEIKLMSGVDTLSTDGYSVFAQMFSGEIYNISQISGNSYQTQKIDGIDFSPKILETPIYTLSKDKYSHQVVTLDFGSDPEIQLKEYSLDNGATWVQYTQPIILTDPGAYKVQARAGDGGGIYSEVLTIDGENNPIIIDSGFPKIIITEDGITVETGTVHVDVKAEVRVDDGEWEQYTGPFLLTEGRHAVEVRLINPINDVLASYSETIEVPAPVSMKGATSSPTVTPSAIALPTATPSATASPAATPSATASPAATPSATASPTATTSVTALPTATPSVTASPTATPSVTATPDVTPSPTAAPSAALQILFFKQRVKTNETIQFMNGNSY